MSTWKLAATLMALTLALATTAHAKDLVLVKDGKSIAVIMTAANPTENAAAAAKELQLYIKEISGAELPIVATDLERPYFGPHGPEIYVGRSKLTDAMPGLKIPTGLTKDLREEGFVLTVRGINLIAAGNDTPPYYGTRYAVVALLHRLGVRWFMPGKFGEVVPHLATISVPDNLDIHQKPDFALRNSWQHAEGNMAQEDEEWKIHNMMSPRAQDWVGVPSDGSIAGFLPKDQFKTHPDWFALGPDGKRTPSMVCMTSPGMINYFVQEIKAQAKAGQRVTAFAPDDGEPRDDSPSTVKLSTGFDGYGANERNPVPESSTSNEWFYFVNTILNQVNQDYPDHLIATNGYANRDIPPELPNFNPNHNLVVMFANIGACTLHSYDDPRCWQMQRQGEMIKRWCQLCDKVWIYNYNYTMLVSKYTITPMVHRLRRDIPLLKQWGVMGFFDQDEADWALTGIPTRIVRAALEWDTHTDVDAFLDDFYSKWYGASAEPMKAYYDALENAFADTHEHGHEDVVLNGIYTPSLMAELDHDIRAAQAAARTDTEKAHVGLDAMIFSYLQNYVAMEAAKREGQYAQAASLAHALMDREAQMHQVTPFIGYHPYPVYNPDWEAKRMNALAARTQGLKFGPKDLLDKDDDVQGDLVTMLPEEARAKTDPFGNGVFQRWQAPAFDDSAWKPLRITAGWDNQGYMDDQGHAYKGVMWYRMNVDVPASAKGKSVCLVLPAVDEEAWLWVNGQYVGHKPYELPWFRPQQLEMDVSKMVVPGRKNQVTFRVLANIDVFGASGIYERGFLYAKR